MNRNPYEILGVSSTDSKDFIKSRYRELCKKYHPDVIGTGDAEKFIEVREAWKLIDSMVSSKNRQYWGHTTLFSVERKSFYEEGNQK